MKIIRSVQPQVVVTFDPFGGYGHPDHIFIHHRATEAFHAAGDAARYPEAGAPYQPQKLYWSVFPKGLIKFFVLVLRVTRRDPTKFGRNGDIDLKEIAAHDYPPTTRIDVWPYYAIKQQAVGLPHQPVRRRPGMFGRLPRIIQRYLDGYETFSPGGTRRRRATS